uniref:Uncharacterized protein n=1 Tax=Ditylenchus dipsaci TaxID=166011 RepID=A0A915CS87_9BILA
MQCNEVPLTVSDVAKETAKDSDLQQLKQHVLNALAISIISGCLMANERVIIPTSLRSQVLTLLHEGHKGIVRMKASPLNMSTAEDRLRKEALVKGCSACSLAAKSQSKRL